MPATVAVLVTVAVAASAGAATPAAARPAHSDRTSAITVPSGKAATPSVGTLRIDSGSRHGLVLHGRHWQADHDTVGGHRVRVPAQRGNRLGATARRGQFSYRIPTGSAGRFEVRLGVVRVGHGPGLAEVRATTGHVLAHWSTDRVGRPLAARRDFDVRVGTSHRLVLRVAGHRGPAAVRWVTVRRLSAHPPAARRQSWKSGVSIAGGASALEGFSRFRRARVSVVNTYQPRTSWSDIATDTWAIDQYAGWHGRLALSVPLVPDGDSADLPAVASGAHNADFASLARNLLERGRGHAIIRLGWEFNVPGHAWSAYNASQWVAAYRQVVDAMRAVAPNLRFDWCGNYGQDQTGVSSFRDLYPGDAYVDIIGVDAYDDQWSMVDNDSQWNRFIDQPGGLVDWARFAAAHHRRFSMPEWGLDASGGGDSAFFVRKMHGFFASEGNRLAFECYFNEPASYIKSSLYGPDQNPRAAAAYRSLWSARA
jgi:hypothetical protein